MRALLSKRQRDACTGRPVFIEGVRDRAQRGVVAHQQAQRHRHPCSHVSGVGVVPLLRRCPRWVPHWPGRLAQRQGRDSDGGIVVLLAWVRARVRIGAGYGHEPIYHTATRSKHPRCRVIGVMVPRARLIRQKKPIRE